MQAKTTSPTTYNLELELATINTFGQFTAEISDSPYEGSDVTDSHFSPTKTMKEAANELNEYLRLTAFAKQEYK